jgi:flagellar protein FlgJ
MASPSVNPALYTDPTGLAALKLSAKAYDPKAIREAAKQFESLFTRMMLKSMRDASLGDPIFGSDQENFYRDMGDDQLAGELSKGHGLGLADMLVQQLTRAGLVPSGVDGPNPQRASGAAAPTANNAAPVSTGAPPSTTSTTASPPLGGTRADFVRTLLPYAQSAGRELGVDPSTLLAHAALETGWGQSIPEDPSGRSSFNLFGIKASSNWNGAAVVSRTREYQGGNVQNRQASFRAYASPSASFQDYVRLLRSNPRYATALGSGTNTRGFAAALQSAGYATDPSYASKLVSVAARLKDYIGHMSLKTASAQPITNARDAV